MNIKLNDSDFDILMEFSNQYGIGFTSLARQLLITALYDLKNQKNDF
jgi:hypothetical protein